MSSFNLPSLPAVPTHSLSSQTLCNNNDHHHHYHHHNDDNLVMQEQLAQSITPPNTTSTFELICYSHHTVLGNRD